MKLRQENILMKTQNHLLGNKIDKNFDKKLIKTVRGIGFKISDN